MARRIADLLIKIGADSYEFQQKTSQVEKSLQKFDKQLSSIGKSLSLKLTAPLTALGAVAIANADTQAKAEAKVQTAIKATGNVAGFSIEQFKQMATEFQNITLFGDETILNDVTTRLLSFTNITGDNFKRTQGIILDMATALEMDLGSATTQLGKALSDPITKLSSLSRAGVTFTKEQEEMIKSMAKAGKTAEAQTIILDALENKFGGQAKAAAQSGVGALQQLKNAWGDFLEMLGGVMTPVINKVSKALMGVINILSAMSPELQKVIVVIGGIAAAIGPVSLGISGVIKLLPALKTGFLALMSPVGALVTAVLALAAAFVYAKQKKKELIDDMATKYEGLSMRTLENNLKENKRLQAVNESESPFQGQTLDSKINYALNKGKRRRELETEQAALEEAIRRRKAAIAEQEKAEAESAAIAQQMSDAMANAMAGGLDTVNTATEETTGLIGELQAKIAELEKKKLLPESTVDDIAAANAEITDLKEQLDFLQNITPEQAARMRNRGSDDLKLPDIKIPMPKLEYEMPDLKPVTSQYQQQAQEIFKTVREGIYGWADDTSAGLQENMSETVQAVETYTKALTDKGWKFSDALDEVATTMKSTMDRFDQTVSQFLADAITEAADALGKMIVGDLGFEGFMNAILQQMAQFLKNIGAQLIEFGVMIIAFKSTLRSVLANPWAAIGVGAAMVAAAAIMTALINKSAQDNVPALASGGLAFGKTYALVGDNANASVDPEVIAPLSRLQQLLPAAATQNMNITLGGELVAKGRDLVYVLNKESFKSSVMGG